MKPVDYSVAYVVPLYKPEKAWAIAGTDYGYLHTTSGDVKTWKTRSGARKALKRYLSR